MSARRLAGLALVMLAGCATARPATTTPATTTATPASATTAPATTTPLPAVGAASSSAPAATPELTSELDKTLYALGVILGRNLAGFDLSAREAALVQRGLADELRGERLVDLEQYGPRVNELRTARLKAGVAAEEQRAAAFVERAAAEPDAQRLPSGVIFRPLSSGSGKMPKATDRVQVHYVGTLADGREFDSSYRKHAPATFPLAGVIPCWTEALQKMRVGERAVLTCPAATAYGDAGRPPTIRGGAALRFEVELLDVVDERQPAP